jgi:hypothetical protein
MVVLKAGQLRANLMLPEPAKNSVWDGLKRCGGAGMGAEHAERHDKMSADKGRV